MRQTHEELIQSEARIRARVALFAAEWERQQGYKPAAFQKAIAMQRLGRGQLVQEVIDSLVAPRV
jgi:hypothetical protein